MKSKKEKISVADSFKSKSFKIGGYSTLISFALLAIIIVVNMIVASLPPSYTKLDTSSNAIYTITDETKDIVAAVAEDITIYHLASTGNEDTVISELLGRYSSLNGRIKIKKIDPGVNPNFYKNYIDEAPLENSLIFESARRSYVVGYNDIYVTSYTEEEYYNYVMYGTPPAGTTSFDGEGKITGAIDYVTSSLIPKLYSLNGHGEKELQAALTDYIKNDNIVLEALSLITAEKVPEDAKCVFINSPESDISSEDAQKLQAYLDIGGCVMLLTSYTENNMPNLYSLTKNNGIEHTDGMIVEGNANYYISGYPYVLIPKIQSSDLTSSIDTSNMYVALSQAHAIKASGDNSSTISYTSLLKTSGAAYIKLDAYNIKTLEKAEGDEIGPFDVGALTQNSSTGGKLIWLTSAYITEPDYDSAVAGGNSTYLLSIFNNVCDKGISVSIAAKSMQFAALVVDDFSGNLWGAVITIIIPAAIITGGLLFWVRRRKR